MRGLIFQIGLLLFFVSIISLWLQGNDIIIAVLKSFIIFVASTLMMAIVAYIFVYLRGEGDSLKKSGETKS